MKKVLVLGGVSFDSIIYMDKLPEPRGQTISSNSYNEVVGGTGAGKSFNLAALGFNTTFHAYIGDDLYGKYIKDSFDNTNVNTIFDYDLAGTQRHTNLMDNNGSRISIYTNDSSFEPQIDFEKLKMHINTNNHIVLNIINYCRYLIPYIKESKKDIWCDIHDYDDKDEYHKDFIQAADYIFLSSDEMPNYKDFMEQLIDNGKKLVICTHGKNGAEVIDINKTWYSIPIIEKYKLIDSNGAGDSFMSGYMYGHSKSYSIEKCLKMATIVAGLSIESDLLYNKKLNPEFLEEEYYKIFK